jgi:hypothetical protein
LPVGQEQVSHSHIHVTCFKGKSSYKRTKLLDLGHLFRHRTLFILTLEHLLAHVLQLVEHVAPFILCAVEHLLNFVDFIVDVIVKLLVELVFYSLRQVIIHILLRVAWWILLLLLWLWLWLLIIGRELAVSIANQARELHVHYRHSIESLVALEVLSGLLASRDQRADVQVAKDIDVKGIHLWVSWASSVSDWHPIDFLLHFSFHRLWLLHEVWEESLVLVRRIGTYAIPA